MAFTTATVSRVERGTKQFNGMYSDMWSVTVVADPSSIAAGTEDIATFTIPGVVVGDHVLSFSSGVNPTVDADSNVFVSAANTVSIRISNLNGASGLDLASSTWKIVVARPAF